MSSSRIFFAVLFVAFSALFAATLAPAALSPAARSWMLLVCNGADCPPVWPSVVAGHAIPNALELDHKKQT